MTALPASPWTRRSRVTAAFALALVWAAPACGPRLMKLPSGPGTVAADIDAVLQEATAACRGIRSLTAEIGVTGSVGGQRVRARLAGGFAPPSVRLEAAAPFGAPLFIFVASDGDATLLLPRDGRVVEHGQPADLLAAIAGVPLGPSDLARTLTGCAYPDQLGSPLAIGDTLRTSAGDGGAKVYLHRDGPGAPWRIVSALYPGEGPQWSWRADYDDFHDGVPRVIRLVSADRKRFNLELALSQLETNVELKPEVFRVDIPRDAQRITTEELRRSGPLGAAKTDGR
jgi:hypothetical protein